MISQRCTECLLPLTQLIVDGQKYGGETVTIHVYMFTQGHSKMCFVFFHSICKMYLPYSGFSCGIIQSGIIIQYCTILFQLLTKKKKFGKKLKTKVRKKKTENLKSIKKRTVAIDSCRRTSDAYINFTEKHKGRNGRWFQRCLFFLLFWKSPVYKHFICSRK